MSSFSVFHRNLVFVMPTDTLLDIKLNKFLKLAVSLKFYNI